MKYWRMAFKWGSRGKSAWEQCFKQGIAAIGYYVKTEESLYEPVVGDCSKISEKEYDRLWRERLPNKKACQGSLKKLAYKMEIGDIIYVKDETGIVGKGRIISDYKFEPNGIVNQRGIWWEHYREVYWDKDFKRFELNLEANLHTVLELKGERLDKILEIDKQVNGEAYDKTINLNPEYSEAWNNKGNALCKLGYYEKAIEAYDKAIELDPQCLEAWNNKGVALCELGYYEKAIESYDKVIGLDTQNSTAWNNKGIALYELGDYEEAIEASNKAIELGPLDSTTWYNKGVALCELGYYEKAIESYDKVIGLDPQDSTAWYNRAYVYYLMKNKDQSILNLKHAIELDSSYKDMAKNDEDFKELWTDDAFKKLTE